MTSPVVRTVPIRSAARGTLAPPAISTFRDYLDRLAAGLDSALTDIQFWLQPIVAGTEGSIESDRLADEILMRPQNGPITNPGAVLCAADTLGRLITTCRQLRAGAAELIATLPASRHVFVNIHPLELLDDILFSEQEPLAVHSSRVVIELTEWLPLDQIRGVHERLEALRDRGFRIALDDVSMGDRRIDQVRPRHLDYLKIDRSLVSYIDEKPLERRLVRGLIEYCEASSITPIAEGVERAEEAAVLESLGCPTMQGYLFGRPAPLS